METDREALSVDGTKRPSVIKKESAITFLYRRELSLSSSMPFFIVVTVIFISTTRFNPVIILRAIFEI